MIGIRTFNDVLEGKINIFDNSNLTGTFDKAIVELPNLGLREVLDAGSTPTLSTFLSPNSLSGVEFPARLDEVLTLRYTLLTEISKSGLSYTIGDNIVYKSGIYNMFAGTNYIFIDKLYLIDREMSNQDTLFLTQPISADAEKVYKAYYIEKCVTALYDIPVAIKCLTLEFSDECCDDCSKGKLLTQVHRYWEALKVLEDCNDCDKQRKLLSKLKKALNIC